MLQIKKLRKTYGINSKDISDHVQALKGISIDFRDSEFVSVLGPSGCGKTTLLNIIGGLDRYTSGDLIINGKSTKEYTDRDWDTYRNHSVGFVFQSYNLISHQTILENVELALTLVGMKPKERRKKAKEALKIVGLSEKINKKPSELSGGQMQRVAIARALVSDPDILLADEPTGALDSETSAQIMDLLKKVSKDRLVIMVTHNPDIAKKYSTRIIKLLDGEITDDSNPYNATKEDLEKSNYNVSNKKTFMKFSTALSLSFRNLMTKKGRTALTAFAGSIGIIGIALIMSLSNGIQNYIDTIERDTLSSYPLTIEKETVDINSMLETMMGERNKDYKDRDSNKIYSSNVMDDMMTTLSEKATSNNLKELKSFLEEDNNKIASYSNDIQYSYNLNLNIYESDTTDGVKRVNPSTVIDNINTTVDASGFSAMMTGTNVWQELFTNEELLHKQYDLVAGKWPKEYNEVVLIADKDGNISDYALYSIGVKDQKTIKERWNKILNGEKLSKEEISSYNYDDLLKIEFKLVLNSDYYKKQNNIWLDKSEDKEYMKNIVDNAETIKIVGIIKQNKESIGTTTGGIGYTNNLTKYVINKSNESEIVKEQKANENVNILTGMEFPKDINEEFNMTSLSIEEQRNLAMLSTEEMTKLIEAYKENSESSYENNLIKLGAVDLEDPYLINIYPKDFNSKELIIDEIDNYNKRQKANDKEENVINYTDVVGIMISSISRIVNIISYVLIAFVSISLIVSSIMIAIITYISVLERTKEIGILRSIGASKKDVSRVFNAETVIEGFVAGIFGIVITLLISIPVNIFGENKLDVSNLCLLPIAGGIGLIILSIILTLIAGLIPSRVASRQDPAVALRSE